MTEPEFPDDDAYDERDAEVCPYCDGVGADPWNDYIFECPECLGEGVML